MYISEKAPAKINLTLDALYKRTDGYHELEMVMTTVDLADRIDMFELPGPAISLESSSGLVPQDERNLAYRAAALLKEKTGIKRGVHIRIHKQIPVAAGLAGGSSDAAATLRGLNRLWKLHLSDAELAGIGAEIGSDVPFCVYANTAIARGRGELLTPLPPPPPCWVVLAKPAHGVSTADVFQRLRIDQIEEHPRTKAMVEAIKNRDYPSVNRHLGNVLESVTMKMDPEVRKIKEKMIQFGADGVLMSGSGPTVFALVKKEARARRLVNGLRGFCQQVYAVRMLGTRSEGVLDKIRTK
ncbi:4-(cytidine 5'-diphospho)-2-C-methyl-D-erythritol kinase [Paenactinomyces guangxiensis]|uniref:4-diphosphocytidyl-2-C-methyl-D-erythritol kinase n=1 Tax=Paenactinomyces guangxiensis TaxID=1490290 RepID=A0A7W2A8P9_9BACL|nr:4-(cytidine 5'-diphospho)-2-C-methyl-D-erythritol kinase [Paenactinomyces guangxiensis]MBA4495826.1 4-(cytidine 5'-diphospho)-2-C-methyl-D-erythritol kinase [Paenactinomyces guangxiensis]MBH8592916.1 4-(cytidine 5'-diphospho)-2-C-methyl-D-erythritol kinase [Paenactinomyces guangxiensis]